MSIEPEAIEEEHKHFARVISTFQQYATYSVIALLCVDVSYDSPKTYNSI